MYKEWLKIKEDKTKEWKKEYDEVAKAIKEHKPLRDFRFNAYIKRHYLSSDSFFGDNVSDMLDVLQEFKKKVLEADSGATDSDIYIEGDAYDDGDGTYVDCMYFTYSYTRMKTKKELDIQIAQNLVIEFNKYVKPEYAPSTKQVVAGLRKRFEEGKLSLLELRDLVYNT